MFRIQLSGTGSGVLPSVCDPMVRAWQQGAGCMGSHGQGLIPFTDWAHNAYALNSQHSVCIMCPVCKGY